MTHAVASTAVAQRLRQAQTLCAYMLRPCMLCALHNISSSAAQAEEELPLLMRLLPACHWYHPGQVQLLRWLPGTRVCATSVKTQDQSHISTGQSNILSVAPLANRL